MLGAAVVAGLVGWFVASHLWQRRASGRGRALDSRSDASPTWPPDRHGRGPDRLLRVRVVAAARSWRPARSATEGVNILSYLPQAATISMRWLGWYYGPDPDGHRAGRPAVGGRRAGPETVRAGGHRRPRLGARARSSSTSGLPTSPLTTRGPCAGSPPWPCRGSPSGWPSAAGPSGRRAIQARPGPASPPVGAFAALIVAGSTRHQRGRHHLADARRPGPGADARSHGRRVRDPPARRRGARHHRRDPLAHDVRAGGRLVRRPQRRRHRRPRAGRRGPPRRGVGRAGAPTRRAVVVGDTRVQHAASGGHREPEPSPRCPPTRSDRADAHQPARRGRGRQPPRQGPRRRDHAATST